MVEQTEERICSKNRLRALFDGARVQLLRLVQLFQQKTTFSK